jgi:phosphate starvation-inducible PhoH-like protein
MGEPKARKKVNQNGKIQFDLKIQELPWTEKQQEVIRVMQDANTRIVFFKGKAGTSKTILSTFSALTLLKHRKVSDILFIRAAVESADSKLGYLPGDVDEKTHFYNLPFADKLEELLSSQDIKKLHDEKRVSGFPVSFARGMHWAARAVIVDEAQNLTSNEIKTLLTRLGEFTRMFILADPDQSDLPKNKQGGFDHFYKLFNDEESKANGIHCFEFDIEDIMRSELLKFIVTKIEGIK